MAYASKYGDHVSVIDDVESSLTEERYILFNQQQQHLIDEVDRILDGEPVHSINVNTTPTITASPISIVSSGSALSDDTISVISDLEHQNEQLQPLISGNGNGASSDDEPFTCSWAYWTRRHCLLKMLYVIAGALLFVGMILLANEVGVSAVNTIRKFKHRNRHHAHHASNPHTHRSSQYSGPSYYRVPDEEMCHNPLSFYDDDDRYGVSCAVHWSSDDLNSMQLSCDEGYVLSCLLEAAYGETAGDCSSSNLEDTQDSSSVLPLSVWSEHCVGQQQCTLEMSAGKTCSKGRVDNVYFNSVNGVTMDLQHSMREYKQSCRSVALKVQALCVRDTE